MVLFQFQIPCNTYDIWIGVVSSSLVLLLAFPVLFPRNVVPCVAGALNETQQLLHRAEAIGAILDAEEMKTCLAM